MVGWRTSSIRREKDLVKVAVLTQLILGNLHVALNEWHLNRSYCSSICSPPIVHWMVISTLWMLSTVRLYHQRDPIFFPRLPELKKRHNELQTQKTPRNTTKWWRVSMNFGLHTYVRWSFPFLGWILNTDSWNRGDDPWVAEGWLEEGGRQLPFIVLALPCSQQHTCMSGAVLLWMLSSGVIFSLQFHPNSFFSPNEQHPNSCCDAGQERVASQRWCWCYRTRRRQYQAAGVTAMSSCESIALAF